MSIDLQPLRNAEKLLIEKINDLKEQEQQTRDMFPPDQCLQEKLGKKLQPIFDQISKTNAALKRIQEFIEEARKTTEQRREERLNEKRRRKEQLRGNNGKEGMKGKKGRTPDPKKKCK